MIHALHHGRGQRMRLKPHDNLWIGLPLCASLVAALGTLAASGAGVAGTHAALGATARLAFLFFLPAYAGSAMAQLFGRRFQPLRAHGREFGLAFAAAFLVHGALIVRLCLIGASPGLATFELFGPALIFLYLFAALSFVDIAQPPLPAVRRVTPSLRLIFAIGMNYIAYAYAVDLVKNPFKGGLSHFILYAPFGGALALAVGLRLAAFLARCVNGLNRGRRALAAPAVPR
jgi:hypothetical protein